MYEPRCLARLYAAAQNRVPIVPVVLMKTKDEHDRLIYDFATAKRKAAEDKLADQAKACGWQPLWARSAGNDRCCHRAWHAV